MRGRPVSGTGIYSKVPSRKTGPSAPPVPRSMPTRKRSAFLAAFWFAASSPIEADGGVDLRFTRATSRRPFTQEVQQSETADQDPAPGLRATLSRSASASGPPDNRPQDLGTA